MSKRLSFSIAVNLLTENFKKGANTVKNSFKSMQMQIVTFAAALGAGGLGLSGLITRLKDTARETNRVLTALKNISGGTAQFGDNLKYLNSLADKYGIAVTGLIDSFAKFSASATQANMPMDQQRKIFESLSRASSAFGLTADENKGVMLALSQMMGKGKISSEELRKQMGEKLPVAMQAMAKAAGTSMAGLEKLLKQGKLMSADILPKFADALNEIVKDVDTDNLEASLNRLDNAFGEFTDATGFQSKYKALIDWLTSAIKSAGENIKNIVVGIVAVIAFVATNASSKVLKSWWTAASEMATGSKKLEAQLASATAARVTAQNNLETARLNHSVATGNARLRATEKVAKAEILHARAVVAEDIARLAVTQSNATRTAGVWTKSFNVIKLGAAKLWVSLKSLWSTFAPAIVVSALVAIGGYMKNLYDQTKWLEKATEDYNKDLATEQTNINILFNRLRKATEGTEDYNKIKNEILSKYGSYLKGLSDEVKSLKDVEGAYKAISAAAIQAARDRAITKNSEKAYDKYTSSFADNATELQKRLSDKFGKEKGTSIYDDIIKSLNEDKELPKEIQSVVDGFNKTYYGSSATGGGSSSHNPVGQLVNNIRVSKRQLNEEIEGIKTAFGEISDSATNNEPVVPIIPDVDPDKNKDSLLKKKLEAEQWLINKRKELENEAEKNLLEYEQNQIDLEEDGFDKRFKQIKLNHKKELLAIREFQVEKEKQQYEAAKKIYISENEGKDQGFDFSKFDKSKLPVGLRPEDIKAEVISRDVQYTKEQEKGLRDINRDLSVMLKGQEMLFASDLDRKLADLDTYYNEQLIKAGDNAELIAQIESNRKRSKSEVKVEDKLNKLDFEEQLKQERIAGMESIGMTELVEEKKLEVTKQYIQLKMAALKELADAGDEDAKNQIKLYEASLKKLDTQKPARA